MDRPNDCGILAFADELARQLEVGDLSGMDCTGYMPPVLAEARHEYTNYDKLSADLDVYCANLWSGSATERARCIRGSEPSDGECHRRDEAQLVLRLAANDAVRRAMADTARNSA